MKKITTTIELRDEIALLKLYQKENGIALREEFMLVYESIKPVNLIKNTVQELTSAPDFKGNLLNTTIGLGAGFLSKKIIVGATHNPLKQLLGTLLQVAITSVVSKNGDAIKSVIMKLMPKTSKEKI